MSKIKNRPPKAGPPLAEKPKIPDNSGIILAAVLILLGIIVALVLQAQTLACSYLNLEKNKLLRTQLRKTAGDGVRHALHVLAADSNLLIDHTNEEWAAPIHFRLPDGIETETIIIDENRFIDVNMLSLVTPSQLQRPTAEIIRDLLAAENFIAPEERTRIIQDWIDSDQAGSYEAAYYQKMQNPVEPANSSMESMEELLWLLETTTNMENNAGSMAVLVNKRFPVEPVNANTAGRETLLAVFGQNNVNTVDRIISLRNSVPLSALDLIVDSPTLQKLASYISVRSSFFSIRAKAKKESIEEEVYCLARRDQSGNVSVIRWVEH